MSASRILFDGLKCGRKAGSEHNEVWESLRGVRSTYGDAMGDSTDTSGPRVAVVPCAECGTLNRIQLNRLGDGPKCARCRHPIALDQPFPVSDAGFDRIVTGTAEPVLVDFFADWCGPCHAMAPALDAFARTRAGKVIVLKLDTDANPIMATRFGIRSIPTLISFQGGKEWRRHVGAGNLTVLNGLVA